MNWQFYVLAAIFIVAGIFHIIKPKAFMRVMPLYIPYHKIIVYFSGIIEIFAGLALLFASTRNYALLTILILLILFIPVHIHMLVHKKASLGLPKIVLFFRLILQFGLMYWFWLLGS